MGWGGSYGANIECYSKSHSSRPGEFKLIYGDATAADGSSGEIYFTHYSGSSTWTNRALLTDQGNWHVDADVIAYSSSVSDVTLKEDITPINNALSIISQLDTIRYKYNYKDDYHYGIKAQQVQELIPEIVKETDLSFHTRSDEKESKLIVRDKELIPFLIESIKELKNELNELKGN